MKCPEKTRQRTKGDSDSDREGEKSKLQCIARIYQINKLVNIVKESKRDTGN